MSDELCKPKAHFSTLLISDLILFCSFIFSNPLYLSYFIFFSPYLLKLISFLSPLFITTFLIFLAFLTGIVNENLSTDLACTSSVLENSRPEKDYYKDERFQGLDDLGMYEILFGTCLMNGVNEYPLEILEKKSEENLESGLDKEKDSNFGKIQGFEAKKMEEKNPGPLSEMKNSCPGMEERRLENFLKILDHFERMSTVNVEEKKKIGTKIDKVVVEGVRNNAATKVRANISYNGGREHTPMVKAHSQRIVSSNVDNSYGGEEEHNLKKGESFRTWDHNNFGSFGSMRKEKEWKRTLACKLFEERHNVDGGEGMDSLWETYELNSDKSIKQTSEKKKSDEKNSEIEFNEECYGNEEDDEEEEEEVVDGQLCCLQAIKFSAGKRNLGMGRPNLVKISKAIKGFGWLHHVSKHSKKVHNNGDR